MKLRVVLAPKVLEKIAVTADGDAYTSTGSNGTVNSLLNRFNSEVGVTTVNGLEEGNLRLTGKIDILRAIGNELHKTSSHFCLVC
jgi:hypothetical protein